MRIYLLTIPIIFALLALLINGYFSFYYLEAVFGEFGGAGDAQWQMAFVFWYWPVIFSVIALALATLIYKRLLKYYVMCFLVLASLPIVLFVLVKYGIY